MKKTKYGSNCIKKFGRVSELLETTTSLDRLAETIKWLVDDLFEEEDYFNFELEIRYEDMFVNVTGEYSYNWAMGTSNYTIAEVEQAYADFSLVLPVDHLIKLEKLINNEKI